MRTVDRDLGRILAALRNHIRERGFTQLEVQEALGWGRSYISQLVNQQKSLRIEQVLRILKVINVEPAEFWSEIFHFGDFSPGRPERRARRPVPSPLEAWGEPSLHAEMRRTKILFEAIVTVLMHKNLITPDDLDAAAGRFR